MIDFAVIGGGIAGVSAAAFLAPHGDVTLFEMEPTLAYHTSGRSAAMLVENYGSQTSRPLVKAGRPFLERPPEGSVDGALLSPRPIIWVADQRGVEGLAVIAANGQAQGSNSRLLDSAEVLEMVPIMDPTWLAGGLLEPTGAEIDVASLHQSFVRVARAEGAEILPEAPVTGLDRDGDAWSVTANGRTLKTRSVVNAAGAWGDEVATLAGVAPIGLQAYRRTAFMVPGRPEWADMPMVVEVGENWYLKPDGVQVLCSLAEETPSAPTDARPQIEDVALAIDRINKATMLGIRSVSSEWAGLRTFAPDRELVIGEEPSAPGFYWLVGQGGIGIQTSPAYGALVASQVVGADLPSGFSAAGVDPERTAPRRFRHS